MIDIYNEVHLMWVGGAVSVMALILSLAIKVVKNFIDKKIETALKGNTTELETIKADLLATNKLIVNYANQMFASISQLHITNKSETND